MPLWQVAQNSDIFCLRNITGWDNLKPASVIVLLGSKLTPERAELCSNQGFPLNFIERGSLQRSGESRPAKGAKSKSSVLRALFYKHKRGNPVRWVISNGAKFLRNIVRVLPSNFAKQNLTGYVLVGLLKKMVGKNRKGFRRYPSRCG